ncbi:sodium:solute symporter family protein [Candidatus Gracilibacteria bacterium]|nr:sodium:solute symporter family protein [Candidatus Gracilibacteria bacterium]
MLMFFVVLYLFVTLAIGLYFARKVKDSNDYILSGRNLPLYIITATAFATWFGAETVIGTSGAVIEEGFIGIIEDPFGVALCLILIGVFFAKKLYNLNLTTLGDFYKLKYGRKVESVASIIIILSYFGWIAAQMLALGKILNIVTGIETTYGILIASTIVIIYTIFGGMYSIARVDFIQMIIIVLGLFMVVFQLVGAAGGLGNIFGQIPVGTFDIRPSLEPKEFLAWIAAWLTLGLGSIPQQDVYQRIMSAKSAKVAMWGSIIAGLLYLTIAMIPAFLGITASILYPELVTSLGDNELVLTSMILNHTNIFTQIIFFGALLSAIMSTASGALLAPSTVLSENIIKPYFKDLSDKKFLLLTRYSVIIMAVLSLGFALTQGSVYELVAGTYSLVLVTIFAPLAFGLYWKKANSLGAMLAMIIGGLTYLKMEYYSDGEFIIPALLVGLLASIFGMILGSLLPKILHTKLSDKQL